MSNNTMNQFQNDVQMMANNLMTQAMCAEKGIDYAQLMQTAQMAHLQGILQQEEQRRIMQVVANHYGVQNTTGIFGKIKQAVMGTDNQPQPMPMMMNPMMGMMNPMMGMGNPMMGNPMVQPMPQVVPVQPVAQPTAPNVDPRVNQLEQEVAGIMNDMNDIKNLLGTLASSMANNQAK